MFFIFTKMIHKRSSQAGIQAHIALEPAAASQSTSNINNNIIINKREDGKEDIVITRDINLSENGNVEDNKDYKTVILETYAQILLNQDKALLSNLIFKNCIIVPIESLEQIIKAAINVENVEIYYNEDVKCCASKVNPIRKIEAIKIIKENGIK